MSGLAGLFGSGVNLDKADFKYNPNKQKAAAQQQQQPQFPFQARVQLFKFEGNTNNPVGAAIFLVRPMQSGYQVLAYQNQAQPFINLQIAPSINFMLRNGVYGYLTDDQNIQWTIQFPDASTAARCAVTIAAVLTQSDGKKLETVDVGVGSGASVTMNDQVTVSYIGFFGNHLPNTQAQFDANEEYNFVIGSEKVIKGYSAGVDGMRIGGTRVVILPPELGYGVNGVRGAIPPNSVLTFLITLKNAVVQQRPQEVATPAPAPETQQAAAPAPTPAPAPVQQPPSTVEKLQRAGAVSLGMPAAARQQLSESESSAAEPPAASKSKRNKKKSLFDDEDDDEPITRGDIGMSVMPTMDENEMLARIDQLHEMIMSKFDSLALTAPVTMKPGDVVYEVQALAAEIEDKERQLREQQQIIDELKKTKQNSRLRAELDIAQTELASLRSVLKGGRDFRKENDELKAELRNLKENKLSDMENDLAELRSQLARSRDISQAAASRRTKELFFTFMGATMEKLNVKFAGQKSMTPKDVTKILYDVFQQCSDEIFKQIDENGII